MSPLPGIYASSFNAGGGPQGAYDALASVTLVSDTASIVFAGIPNGYKHLQLRIIARATYAPSNTGGVINFNGDFGANYSWHRLVGDGGSATSSAGANATFARVDRLTGSSQASNTFGAIIVDILDYASTTKSKTVKAIGGYDDAATGWISLNSALWMSTSAITSITFANADSTNLVQFTQVALYGVK